MNIDDPITILTADLRHFPEIVRLERQSSTAAHWSEEQYGRLFQAEEDRNQRLALVAQRGLPEERGDRTPTVLGFLIARHLAPEWELENIVVALGARGQGIGRRLVEEFLARAKQSNGLSIFLEVRDSNAPARALYEKLGFRQTGRRKSYYTHPEEDAILYWKNLGQGPISS